MVRISSKLGLSLFYLISTVLVEILTFCMLDIGFFPKNFLYDLAFMLMFMGIIFIIPNYLIQYLLSMIIIGAQFVLMYVNYSLYHLYGDVFSFDMIKLFNETKHAITSDFTFIWLIVVLVALFLVFGLIGFLLYKRLRVYQIPFHKNFSIFMIMIVLIVQGVGISVYNQQSKVLTAKANINSEDYVLSDSFLRDTTMLKIASLKSLGTYGYYVNNIMNLLSTSADKAVIEQSINYFKSGETFGETDSSVFGVDEGNNVIVIMMESLEWIAFSNGTFNSRMLSQELTPNVYRLIKDGFIATDFFSKSKTNISEGIGFLGSYPIGKYLEQVSGKKYVEDYGFSLPNVLKNYDYETCYLHPNTESFYSRHSTHKYLGFDHTYFAEDCLDESIKWDHWMKEEDFVRSALDDGYLIPEDAENGQKFYSFYTTVSTHGPYVDNSNNEDQEEYKELVRNSNWYNNICDEYSNDIAIKHLLNYQEAVVGFDMALGVILDTLDEKGLYDSTTIVLYSDHDAYYHSLANFIKGVPINNYSDTDLNTVPLIIKSAGVNNKLKEVGYYASTNTQGLLLRNDKYGNIINSKAVASTDRFCSAYDIVPTLLDLLGINFNKNFYAGTSLFSPIEDRCYVYTGLSGVKTEEIVAYYSHTGGVFGRYVNTKDMSDYDFSYPEGIAVSSYDSAFKKVAKRLLLKLNYISTLYSYGIYSDIYAS
ncbi:MAG: sulfatase-like hydrolase/transferase [Clostridia bacterium]|nr:sulfatase-like hydrolase/transferase [Clostridia bacterium]